MSKDYSYLEGTEFIYHTGMFGIPAKVLYADYHIGLTCVDRNNPDHYLICLNGPNSPQPHRMTKRAYKATWDSLLAQIKRGLVDAIHCCKVYNKHTKKVHKTAANLSAEDCAFGQ